MSRKRRSQQCRRPVEIYRAPEEWIGGRLPGPAYAAEDVPTRPDLVIWMAGDEILRVELVRAAAPLGVVGEQLRKAMCHPLVGPPRRPRSVRVSDPALVAVLWPILDAATPIEVGPTPALERLREALGGDATAQ